MLAGKKILLGITGSIAAYKAAFLVRLLIKEGAEVKVIMTEAGTKFVAPLTLSTLSKNPVFSSISTEEGWNNHVELGLWADLFIIAPTTTNTIAKMAAGMADNMLTVCYLSARCPVLIAPAMDVDMWHHPATQRNLTRLKQDGVKIIPVEYGELASGLTGMGRMAEPEQILQYLADLLTPSGILAGINVLVTAGPTYEEIDPVRFIGNRSSGKMGLSLAYALLRKGAKVTLILGPNHLQLASHPNLKIERVTSAAEMADRAKKAWPECRVAILAAAVADYTPASRADQKIKKNDANLHLELVRTEDIAASLGSNKEAGQITVGFALETENEIEHAQRKIKKKNFDFIVLNSLNDPGAGFQHDTNQITIITNNGEKFLFDLKSKTEVAEDIVDVLEKQMTKKQQT
ncbi:MAG: bifunctional phosphopantothenoylcysteine decarboxylase/phosphopantothenate--cysteine ligase CoaBC [Saprospiraceae bacterium]|nr:bifunctional phosphopantothenoylcysteine decarboxylase/phosphopantothenate--cysteine ligase CoaBC [Saprospiraceae bacterium]